MYLCMYEVWWEMAWYLRCPHVCYVWPNKCSELHFHMLLKCTSSSVSIYTAGTTTSFDCDCRCVFAHHIASEYQSGHIPEPL